MRKTQIVMASLAAPIALTLALAAPLAVQGANEDHYWEARKDVVWETRYDECWKSKDGPTDLPPCGGARIVASKVFDLVNDEFDFDKSILRPDMKVALDQFAREVRSTPGDEQLTIIGHTDSVGSDAYNFGLGQRRADATRDYLIRVGGLDPSRISTRSAGENEPLVSNDTDAGRAKNRRIEVRAEAFGG